MRIGTFLLILLAATVALGFFMSDTIHLREDLTSQQQENQKLLQALQQAELEKQNAQTTLENTSLELNACQQTVARTETIINQLVAENATLKNHNQQLEISLQSPSINATSIKTAPKNINSATVRFASFTALGLVFAVVVGAQYVQRGFLFKSKSGTGQYVFLSREEIAYVIKQRRKRMSL